MAMTALDFLAYVQKIFGRDSSDDVALVYEAMTDTLHDLLHRFPNLEKYKAVSADTAATDNYVAIPTDMGFMLGDLIFKDISNPDDSKVLIRISRAAYNELIPYAAGVDTGDKSEPTHYCIFDEKAYLYPYPDLATYRFVFEYLKDDADEDIDADTTTMPLGDAWRELFRFGVLYRAFYAVENDEQAQKYKVLYEDEIRKYKEMNDHNVDDSFCVDFTDI